MGDENYAWIRYDLRADEWVLRDKTGFDVPMPALGEGEWMTMYAPAGFRFDLGSIPRVFWGAIAPHEISVEGALAHDWLYQNGASVGVDRKTADVLLRSIMEDAGVKAWKVGAVYRAVRLFGWRSWRK